MSDQINHPGHYNVGSIEVIDAIDAWALNFNLGNVVKYVARAEHKGVPLVDLKKAAWYLAREITTRKMALQVQVQQEAPPVAMEFKRDGWQQLGPDNRNELELKIRKVLYEKGGSSMHLRALAKAVGLPTRPEHVRYRSFTTFMSRLHRRGVVVRDRRGFYALSVGATTSMTLRNPPQVTPEE